MQRRHSRRAAGFTLVEVGITLVIIALAAGVIVPALGNVSRADLRRAASGLAATLRACYDNAALEGITYRLTLTPGKRSMLVESTEAAIVFNPQGGAVATAPAAEAAADDPLDGLLAAGGGAAAAAEKPLGPAPSSALAGLAGINKLSEQAARSDFHKVGSFTMPAHVEVLDVWTEGMATSSKAGEAYYLYFFAGGYTQDAIINLQDGEHRIFGLRIAPFTGRSTITPGYVEAPQ